MQKLSHREEEVLQLIVDEQSSVEISDLLNISIRTVETHRKNIAKKIGSSSLVAFTKYAIQHQIIQLK
ncbi:MAG: helix-turn-helix transcriptional regulator [Flavobacteriales bacterium]|jgi:two-component system NarL family response regulator|nr:helix-turn-helix transcriptional regulator [Flavobacteriales bacterium]MCB9363790.1 helix-turn-helix transcriptional regulator [Flavobacteriales bacterium]